MQAKRLLTSIEHVTRSTACRVAFRPWGRHAFGGKLEVGYEGIKPPAPIHHFMTLDTHDRRSPILFESVRYVPLIFPLAYSSGGGEISYRMLDDRHVEIVHLSEYRESDDPYVLFDELPERRAVLKPFTYPELRILSVRKLLKRSFLDRMRMKRLWNGNCYRISGILDPRSVLVNDGCPAAKADGDKKCDARIFAKFTGSTVPFGDIWHEYSEYVDFCFAICTRCSAIHAFIECT